MLHCLALNKRSTDIYNIRLTVASLGQRPVFPTTADMDDIEETVIHYHKMLFCT